MTVGDCVVCWTVEHPTVYTHTMQTVTNGYTKGIAMNAVTGRKTCRDEWQFAQRLQMLLLEGRDEIADVMPLPDILPPRGAGLAVRMPDGDLFRVRVTQHRPPEDVRPPRPPGGQAVDLETVRKHAESVQKSEHALHVLTEKLRKLATQLECGDSELRNPNGGDSHVNVASRIITRYMKEMGEHGICFESMLRYAAEADTVAYITAEGE